MAWGEWMVPQVGPEHELTLERQRRAIDGYNLQQAQDMLWRLCQLATHQDIILRAATKRIAELELSIELGVPPKGASSGSAEGACAPPELEQQEPAQGLAHVPWPIRVLRAVIGSQAG